MASSNGADAATEALIAQLLAEDFGEAYADHMRPIGSHAGDYEDPLTSYERQCLENPDMEDGEGGWNPPTPVIEEAPPLPEGETWDSSFNNDPRIESTPAFASSENGESDEIDSEGITEAKEDLHRLEDAIDNGSVPAEPLHHLQDPVDYHTDQPTQSPTRHASVPAHELVSPTGDSRRVISDPSRLETTADSPQQDSPSPVQPEPTQPHSPEPIPLSPKATTTSTLPFRSNLLTPTIATNERLLALINKTSDLNIHTTNLLNKVADNLNLSLEDVAHFDTTIDTSSAKNKGKAPTPSDPDTRIRDLLTKYKALFPNGIDPSNTNKTSDKGKAPEDSNTDIYLNHLITYISRKKHNTKPPPAPVMGEWGDESLDEESGLLLLRVPWPASGARDREAREAMEAQVHEVWVGEEETVGSILMDIRRRDEVRGRAWGSWGADDDVDDDDVGDGVEIQGKGKGKAVEC